MPRKSGFSAGANLGARDSGAEYLVFMNPDTLPTEDRIAEMVAVLEASRTVASCGQSVSIPPVGVPCQQFLGCLRTVWASIGSSR